MWESTCCNFSQRNPSLLFSYEENYCKSSFISLYETTANPPKQFPIQELLQILLYVFFVCRKLQQIFLYQFISGELLQILPYKFVLRETPFCIGSFVGNYNSFSYISFYARNYCNSYTNFQVGNYCNSSQDILLYQFISGELLQIVLYQFLCAKLLFIFLYQFLCWKLLQMLLFTVFVPMQETTANPPVIVL